MTYLNYRGEPTFPDVAVMAVVPDHWDAHWQTRHHLVYRLARHFNVIWYNPVQEWRMVRFDQSFSPWFQRKQHSPGLVEFTSSSFLPRLYRPAFAARLADRIRLAKAQNALNGTPVKKWVVYLWRPQFASVLDNARCDVSCYHIDDEYSFSSAEQPSDPTEIRVIQRVDQVFIHSQSLMERKGGINPNTLRVPNGVDYASYSADIPEALELKDVPHPRLGYIGYLKTHLDLQLHLDLARSRPQWHFVFVGPIGTLGSSQPILDALFSLTNVHYLGAKHPRELPSFARHFDVCLMGYAINNYTRYIYPLKMQEYLATGVPVISTPIPAALEYSQIIQFGSTVQEWQEAVEKALGAESRSPEAVSARQRVARQYDWDRLTDRVAEAMCRHLGPEYLERFQQTILADGTTLLPSVTK